MLFLSLCMRVCVGHSVMFGYKFLFFVCFLLLSIRRLIALSSSSYFCLGNVCSLCLILAEPWQCVWSVILAFPGDIHLDVLFD